MKILDGPVDPGGRVTKTTAKNPDVYLPGIHASREERQLCCLSVGEVCPSAACFELGDDPVMWDTGPAKVDVSKVRWEDRMGNTIFDALCADPMVAAVPMGERPVFGELCIGYPQPGPSAAGRYGMFDVPRPGGSARRRALLVVGMGSGIGRGVCCGCLRQFGGGQGEGQRT
jgi:hypothetical protein